MNKSKSFIILLILTSTFSTISSMAQEEVCKNYVPAPNTYNPLQGMQSRLNVLNPKISDQRLDIYTNIHYRNNNNIRNKMDAYLPTNRKPNAPIPIIIFVHGGAWVTGNKQCIFGATGLYETVRKKLLNNGIGVFSINYRYANNNPEEQISDVQAAVEMVRSLSVIGKYSCQRIGISGDSAGSHLAQVQILRQPENITKLYVGTAGPTKIYDLVENAKKFKAQIVPHPQCDKAVLMNPLSRTSFYDFVKTFTGGESHFKDACINPYDMVANSDACWNKNTSAAMMYIHGSKDPLVNPAQSSDMVELLKNKGYKATLFTLPFQHGGSNGQQNQQMASEFLNFVSTNLK